MVEGLLDSDSVPVGVGALGSAENSSLLESESSESDIDPERRASSSFVLLSSGPDTGTLETPSVMVLLSAGSSDRGSVIFSCWEVMKVSGS